MPQPLRCPWPGTDLMYIAYHDREWGVPLLDDRAQFEMLILEGAQAGLSWLTILKRREGYRRAFAGFDPEKVAAFTPADQERLLLDPGIIRNRRKVEAAVKNARAFLKIQEEKGSFCDYLWGFVDGRPIQNAWKSLAEVPAETELSRRVSRDLKARGMNFVGPTIIYAHMQSTGLVNDHLVGCFRHAELGG